MSEEKKNEMEAKEAEFVKEKGVLTVFIPSKRKLMVGSSGGIGDCECGIESRSG